MALEEKILAGLIVALASPFLIYLVKRIYDLIRKKHSIIKIDLSGELPDVNLKLILRYIRDGKDEVDDRGEIINKDYKVKICRNEKKGIVKIVHNKSLGFQYVCYVDFNNISKDVVSAFLKANKISETSYDESSKKRIWFLLPSQPCCDTVDGYKNNYFHSNNEST